MGQPHCTSTQLLEYQGTNVGTHVVGAKDRSYHTYLGRAKCVSETRLQNDILYEAYVRHER